MSATETTIETWFRTSLEAVRATGTRYVLSNVAGPVEIFSDLVSAPALSWPAVREYVGPPLATVVLTSGFPPGAAARLLDGPTAQRSDDHGRGAFPVR
ncbi:hypothetical protein [Streptomyces cremeus]|uniref:Uncharacterized protein n=1 Tax=Streptomyces cremeus TaxID=66881 RepID=A0ABV5P5H9_STRCM